MYIVKFMLLSCMICIVCLSFCCIAIIAIYFDGKILNAISLHTYMCYFQ